MKKLMAFSIIFAFSITLVLAQTPQPSNGSVVIQTANPSATTPHRIWNLVITTKTTKRHLDSVSAAWKKDSIDLKFTKLQYKKGKLMILSGSVNFMSKDKQPSAMFTQDSIYLHPLQIKLNDKPGVFIRQLN